jgi:aminoglycoside 6'-N-acetyltransferase
MAAVQPPVPRIESTRAVLVPVRREHAFALRAIRMQPDVARWWHDLEPDFPLEDPGSVRYAVLLRDDDRPGTVHPLPRGLVQYDEEPEPDYRHAGVDLFLDTALHGQGYGREVVAAVCGHLIDERGHHRITIDPASDNAAAIACYAAVGFQPVGVMRRYERGPDGSFHDALLMDLLADELIRLP